MTIFAADVALAADEYNLDPILVEAVVRVESSGDPWAWNPEPRYRYFYNVLTRQPFRPVTNEELSSKFPPTDFPTLAGDPDQEWWGQQASWGLCQVMGAVARELGFRGHYLSQLCDPRLNLHYGCQFLRSHLNWADGQIVKALGAYNAGRGGWDSPAGRVYAFRVRKEMAALYPVDDIGGDVPGGGAT